MDQVILRNTPAIEVSSKHLKNNNSDNKIIGTKCFTCQKCLGTLCWTEKICINFSEYEKEEVETSIDD